MITECEKHPKYTAQKQPRADCSTCWNMYFQQQRVKSKRHPTIKTKVHKDKTKYDRSKEKQRLKEETNDEG